MIIATRKIIKMTSGYNKTNPSEVSSYVMETELENLETLFKELVELEKWNKNAEK